MKRYQIAILFFAVGIFTVTLVLGFLLKNRPENTDSPSGLLVETPMVIKVYFSNNIQDPGSLYCEMTYPTERDVYQRTENTEITLGELSYLAMVELLKGPNDSEKNSGFFTSINENVRVKTIVVGDGVATIDFDKTLNEGVAGSCRVQAIRSQITETLKQFADVKEVVISVEGEIEEILQP